MPEESKTQRIESFSDGIFAIAMTLLVIEIKVPGHELIKEGKLGAALWELWPSYLAFLTSFVNILVIWVQHHWIFVLIKRYDLPLFYLNGILLLCVTFVPFPTALMAEYLLYNKAEVAANIYTGTFLAIALAFDALWRHASVNLLSKKANNEQSRVEAAQITLQYRLGPPLYLVAFITSFFYNDWSVVLCLLLALFFSLRSLKTLPILP